MNAARLAEIEALANEQDMLPWPSRALDLITALREARELAEQEHEARKWTERCVGSLPIEMGQRFETRKRELDAAYDAAKETW